MRLMSLPEFEKHWKTVSASVDFDADPSLRNQHPAVTVDTIVSYPQTETQRAWIRPLLISVGYFQFQFPQIMAFLPANLESQKIFKQIGVPF